MKNVAALEVTGTRGEATVRRIAGRVEIVHRGGDVTIEEVGSLEFNGRSGVLKLTGVSGDASIKMDQGGEITASGVAGGLDLESRNAHVTLKNLEPTRGPIRINANGGEVEMKGLRSEARIDARNVELSVVMAAPAPVAIYNEGERLVLTAPPGGFTLDALIKAGRVTSTAGIEQLGIPFQQKGEDEESRVVGPVRGGGPTITVRSTRADFDLQAKADKPEDQQPKAR